ncbi:hypothetical protein E1B28_009709 [Marasmius oreades]|uniref:Uncharacterized protein n=1 Tax=Marasmius oreades TaxID=181124 RepID=A0A9P7RWB0_9AGAR|nr:uncharacterized protein E1B28_009709 [Marasmius oreades]KAG7090607.1 hypothetical protein E1B28_009709 [Marasmius oreades]
MQPGAERLYLCLLAFIIGVASAEENLVHWISPSAGDYLGPGDTVIGKWASDKAVVSPSFKVCQGSTQSSVSSQGADSSSGSEACGTAMFPTVQQDDGAFFVSLTVPNVTTIQPYYLQMTDNFGNMNRSPSFSLSPSGSAPVPQMKKPATPPTDERAQIPMTVDSKAPEQEPPVSPGPISSLPNATNPVANTAPGLDASHLGATRNNTPPAALAVPLSIAGAILLAAVCFLLRQSKITRAERRADMEKMHEALKVHSDKSQSAYNRPGDIESGLPLGKNMNGVQGFGFGPIPTIQAFPIPLFMPPTDLSPWFKKEAQHAGRYTPPPLYSGRSAHRSSRTRSVRSLVSSYRSGSSRPIELPDGSSVHLPRPPSLSSRSSRSSRTRVCLPSIKMGDPLYDERQLEKLSRSKSGESENTLGSGVTGLVLEDYMLPSADPPPCLLPAPQRIHLRDESLVEEKLVNPYDAVAASLKSARRT